MSDTKTARMSNTQFGIIIAVIACPIAAAGAFYGVPLLMVAGIMLAPLAFVFRGRRVSGS